jgi:hypothetical protein
MAVAISAALLSSAFPLMAASLGEKLGNGAAYAGLHGGTLGVGVNAGYDISNDLAIRGLVNYFNLDFDKKKAGNEYKGEVDLRSVGLVLDWHPFWGAFRVSGGAFLNNNRLSASTEGVDLGIGLGEYDADLNFRMDFAKTAPYLGIGWTSGRGRGGLSFTADIGALIRSAPRVSASGQVSVEDVQCEFSVSRDGNAEVHCPSDQVPNGLLSLGSDLQDEHSQLREDLDKLKVYPVVSLGVSYRF